MKFYEKIYTSTNVDKDKHKNTFFPTEKDTAELTEEQKENCENGITEAECLEQLKLMKKKEKPLAAMV